MRPARRIKISKLPDFDLADLLQCEGDRALYWALVLNEGDPVEFVHALNVMERSRRICRLRHPALFGRR